VRRRDGAIAYHLAGVVDDARERRHADRARARSRRDHATQVALQRLLGIATPRYRHHLLLLERRGAKLAKLHGAVGFAELRAAYRAPALCGCSRSARGLRATARR
jgi:glutamyl/glutaminyl-tRNA synthetase